MHFAHGLVMIILSQRRNKMTTLPSKELFSNDILCGIVLLLYKLNEVVKKFDDILGGE